MHVRSLNAAVFLLSSTMLPGCNIVQGFKDAKDAIFPSEMTYLDAPGLRLVAGGYRGVQFAEGSKSLYLVARSAALGDLSLYAMPYADPKPCAIPNVGDYTPGAGVFDGPAIIAYHPVNAATSLKFADATCRLYDLTIADSSLPLIEVAKGFVVYVSGDIILADPVAGTTRTIASSVDAAWWSVLNGRTILRSSGQLVAFLADPDAPQYFGDGVVSGGGVGDKFFFEDRIGIHRLSAPDDTVSSISDTVISPTGCSLGIPPPVDTGLGWATYYDPCAQRTRVVYSNRSERAFSLDVPDTARQVALVPAFPLTDGNPAVDPFYVFYLTDVGSLFVQTPNKQQYKLGDNAALERVSVVGSADRTYGYAMVDVSGDAGRYLRWEASDGSTTDLALNVRRSRDDILINFDGQKGDFALPSGGEISVVARQVPAERFRFQDWQGRWSGVLHDFDGSAASLSITDSSLDRSTAAHSLSPTQPVLTRLATGVAPDFRARFLYSLPGVAYLAAYDPTLDTGRMEYRNLELGFTATVSYGVSDYVSTTENVVYCVPFGDGAGIWVARAR